MDATQKPQNQRQSNYGNTGQGSGMGIGQGQQGLYDLNPQALTQFTQVIEGWRQQAQAASSTRLVSRFDKVLDDLNKASQEIGQEPLHTANTPAS